jgi:hypothetical protein
MDSSRRCGDGHDEGRCCSKITDLLKSSLEVHRVALSTDRLPFLGWEGTTEWPGLRNKILRIVSVGAGRGRREDHPAPSQKPESERFRGALGAVRQARVSIEVDPVRRVRCCECWLNSARIITTKGTIKEREKNHSSRLLAMNSDSPATPLHVVSDSEACSSIAAAPQ